MIEQNQTNQSSAGEAGQEAVIQATGQPEPIVPGLREAIAAAFSVPLGPAILLGLVLKQIGERFAEANAGMDISVEPANRTSEENTTGLPRAFAAAAVAAEKFCALLTHASEASASLKAQMEQVPQLAKAQLAGGRQITTARANPEAAQQGAGGQDNDSLGADQLAQAGVHKITIPDHREEPEGRLDRPATKQFRGETAVAVASELEQTNQAGAAEKKPVAQLEHFGPDPEPPLPGARNSADLAQAAEVPPAAHLFPPASESSRAPATVVLEQHTQRAMEILDRHGGIMNETLDRLAAETRRRQQQTIAIVESIIARHVSLQTRMEQLEAQLASHRNTNISG